MEREIKKLTKEEIEKLKEELKDCVSYSDYLNKKLNDCPSAEDLGICDKKCWISDNYESIFLLILIFILFILCYA